MRDVPMKDYLTLDNAVNGGGPSPRPGSVSFRVTWTTTGPAVTTDVALKPFHGEHAPAAARMEWAGRAGDYEFLSKPIGTSSSPLGALLGRERNGSFY
jgi:hypothetical protein